MRPTDKKSTTESIELYRQSLQGNNYSVQSIKAYLGDLAQFIKWLQMWRVDFDIPYRIERIDIVQFINHLAEQKGLGRHEKTQACRNPGISEVLEGQSDYLWQSSRHHRRANPGRAGPFHSSED